MPDGVVAGVPRASTFRRAGAWWAGIALAYGALIAAAFRHLRFGVDVWDESFYVALAYRFIRGDVPLRDELDPHQFSALIASPLYAAFLAATHSTQGIIPFARVAYLLITLGVLAAVSLALAPVVGRRLAVLVCLPLVIYTPMGISGLSYNSIMALTFLLSCVWATRVVLGGPIWMAPASGFVAGVCAFAYPTMLVAIVPLQLFFVWTLWRQKRRHAFWPLAGVSAVLLPAVTALLAYGPGRVAEAYRFMNLDHTWLGGGSKLLRMLLISSADVISWPMPFLLAGVAVLAMKRSPTVSRIALVVACGLAVLGTPTDRMMDPVMWSPNPIATWGLVAVVLFFGVKDSPLARTLFGLMVIPSILAACCMTYSSSPYFNVGGQGMLAAVLTASLFSAWIAGVKPGEDIQGVSGLTVVAVVVVFTLGTAAIWWVTPRHDLAPRQLTARVTGGPWDGLYTIPQRAQHLNALQDQFGRSGRSDERGVVVSGAPGLYLLLQCRVGSKLLWMTQPGATRSYVVDQMRMAAPPDFVVEDTYLERTVPPDDVLRTYLASTGFAVTEQGPSFSVYRR